ncbi:hypothetical protein [Halovivax sp.]|uniref:hypothetical protein n=1 Tax=Halovivax sp. TaxID=1935978 RepID=UPI0025C320AE|nr:hypothetical protein [Halovivax sp.]
MSWIAALTFAAAASAAGALAGGLAAHVEHQPEHPSSLADGMRGIGLPVALAGIVLGTVLLGYAVVGFGIPPVVDVVR